MEILMENDRIEIFWKEYQKIIGDNNIKYDNIFSFGNNDEMANRLSALVVEGKKRATTGLYKLYELDNEKIPKRDELSIVLNGCNEPVAIIKNTEIKIVLFKTITDADAKTEGEGDGSLKYWRCAHIKFFEEECRKYKIKFSEDMLVVFEIFEIIYSIKNSNS